MSYIIWRMFITLFLGGALVGVLSTIIFYKWMGEIKKYDAFDDMVLDILEEEEQIEMTKDYRRKQQNIDIK